MTLEWDNLEAKIDGRQLHHFGLADDIVLITPNISQAERILADVDNACGKICLRLNLTKTMFMRNDWFRMTHSCSTERKSPNTPTTSIWNGNSP
ncbi:unnamed protein product [Angiostrongylus costaricensis]|uniref:Reverse transcriptase domain-containing protein n=1 Tax=Angiostrongylus costaricensis TaxID=334426 RepID=A0A0R3PMX7_ANGCS|nr:unnamed protein product [Angiostrongylus costaricensis]